MSDNESANVVHAWLLAERQEVPASLSDARLSRESSALKAARFRREINKLIQEKMPCIARVPAEPSLYEDELRHFKYAVATGYSSIHDRRAAFEQLADFVRAGTARQEWNLLTPGIPVVAKRPLHSKKIDQFQFETRAFAVAMDFLQALETPGVLAQVPPDVLQALVVYSAAAFGQENEHPKLVAVYNSLSEDRPVSFGYLGDQSPVTIAWLEYELEASVLRRSNYREDGTKRFQGRLLLDPITLFLTAQLMNRTPARENPSPKNAAEIFSLMISGFELLGISPCGFKSLSSLVSASSSVVESLDGCKLNKAQVWLSQGSIKTVPLDHEGWRSLFKGPVFVSTPMTYRKLNLKSGNRSKRRDHSRTERMSEDVGLVHERIDEFLKAGVSGNLGASVVIERLRNLSGQTESTAARLYVEWLLEHLEARNNTIKTADRYHDAIGADWLLGTQDIDIYSLELLDFEVLYDQILSICVSDDDRMYSGGRLQDLHKFLCASSEDIPDLTDALVDYKDKISHVRVGYLTSDHVSAAKRAISGCTGVLPEQKEALEHIFAASVRLANRPEELARIRLNQVSDDLSRIYLTGRGKTSASPRTLPVGALMTPDEFDGFARYFKRRKAMSKSSKDLLFSEAGVHGGEGWDTLELGRFFAEVLRTVTGNDRVVFYHARHTGISNVMLAVEKQPLLAEVLAGFSPEQASRIREEIVGNERNIIEQYSAVSVFSGHVSPEMIFSVYGRLIDLSMHFSVREITHKLSISVMKNLIGSGYRSLKSEWSKSGESSFNPNDYYDAVLSRAGSWALRYDSSGVHSEVQNAEEDGDAATLSLAAIQRSVELYIQGKDDASESMQLVAFHNAIELDEAERVVKVVHTSASLSTRQGNSRAISTVRKDRGHLLPHASDKSAEKEQLKYFYRSFQKSYPEMKNEVRWVVLYYIKHTISSSSGIRFRKLRQLRLFLETMNHIVPSAHWRVSLVCPVDIDLPELEDSWKAQLDVANVEFATKRKDGRRSATAYLFLRHSSEKDFLATSEHMTKYSSPILRWLFYLMAIATLSVDDAEQLVE